MNHIPYPSIDQFRHAVRNVKARAQYVGKDENGDAIYDPLLPLPVLDYQGVTKTHGTNLALCRNKETGETWVQSRERIVTPERDNAGSARFFSDKNLDFLFDQIEGNLVVIYGEFAGKGINSKVAVCKLPKMMIVFDIFVDNEWLPAEKVAKIKAPGIQIYNVYDYGVFNLSIDFNRHEEAQNKLIEITTQVADCCPVGKAFGVEGIGEGVVWRCVTPGWESFKLMFKVKDERHQGSKIVKLQPVDNERVTMLRELAEKLTPVWRLEQMIEKACDLNNNGFLDLKKIGEYFKLVNQDIVKEESDVLAEAGVEFKDVVKYVTEISKKYFIEKERGEN